MLNKHAQIFHIVLNLGKYIDMSVGGQFDYFLKLFHVSASLPSLPSLPSLVLSSYPWAGYVAVLQHLYLKANISFCLTTVAFTLKRYSRQFSLLLVVELKCFKTTEVDSKAMY